MQIRELSFDIFISQEKLQARIQEMGAELSQLFVDKNPLFIIVLNGAFIFAADLIRNYKGNCETLFTRIKTYTGTASGEISEFTGLSKAVNNRDVIFIEDIIDTGKTVYHLQNEIELLHPASVTIVTLLQKNILRPNLVKADIIGFEIPDVFVVGYGLDYKENGRNLPEVWSLKQ